MPHFAVIPASDNRRTKQAAPPVDLINCLVRRTPDFSAKARRAPYFIGPTPGRTLRATLNANVRGIFAAPGCRMGHVFIADGADLSEMTETYSHTVIGTITGGDFVTMRADRDDLAVRAFGELYQWDGTTFTNVSDVDAPSFAQTLAIVARRWVAAFQDNDAFGWSKAGLFNDWDANGQAADQDLPDPIVGQETIGGDLWSFNAESTWPWQPTGGAEASAFARVQGVSIPHGLAGRHAIAPAGAGAMLLGHTRQVLGTSGYNLEPVANPALVQDLKALTASELADCAAWSYRDGDKEFWGLSTGVLEHGYVFDLDTGLWHQRSKYEAAAYDIDFACTAFGKVFVASRSETKIWTLEEDVYTDDGDPILRDFMVHVPSSGEVPVDRLVFDITTRDVPATGQGSEPTMQVRTSDDGGESWSDWRTLDLPTPANKFHVQDFAWGTASVEHGMIVHMRISDPIGFAMSGLWVNPTDEELNT